MRFRPRHSHGSATEAVNATPLIDVVMCLIIFFLIVGQFAADRGLRVNLPRAGSGRDESSPAVMVITVAPAAMAAAAGQAPTAWAEMGVSVQVDGRAVESPTALENAVRAQLLSVATTGFQVRADRDLSYGAVEPVLRAIGRGGAVAVRLATERAP
jgi:biopolymer transport protein ExbD